MGMSCSEGRKKLWLTLEVPLAGEPGRLLVSAAVRLLRKVLLSWTNPGDHALQCLAFVALQGRDTWLREASSRFIHPVSGSHQLRDF